MQDNGAGDRLRGIRGVGLDLDGVLYVEETPVPGAAGAVRRLGAAGLPVRYLTNSTMRSRRALVAKLSAMGFPAREEEVLSAPVLGARAIRAAGVRRIAALVLPEAIEDFGGFEITDDRPEAVVVGDLGDAWTPAILNRALNHLLGGARLVALNRARVWRRASGIVLDAGPYVAALEFAAGVTAQVVGKPSRGFFDLAVESLGVAARDAVMIGDDPESDVAAAQEAGMRGILVLSGKVGEREASRLARPPDAIFPSVAEAAEAILTAR